MSALEFHNVEVAYQRARGRSPTTAVAGVSLSVKRGQIVGLVGESGCGKSSLARAAMGMIEVTAGSITFDGNVVPKLKSRARSRDLLPLQMVFQNPYSSLNPRRKVGDQIGDTVRVAKDERPSAVKDTVTKALEMVGLSNTAADRYPHQFSGGQRQRIAIARAVAADPSVIILDEPLSSLDTSAQAQIANLLVKLTEDLNVGLLLISHDLAIVGHVADAVAVMYAGRIVEYARADDLWVEARHPYTRALMAAVPSADGEGDLPLGLLGEVPDPAKPPSGCRFHPRCPYVFDRCTREVPRLTPSSGGHLTACWLTETAGPAASYAKPRS